MREEACSEPFVAGIPITSRLSYRMVPPSDVNVGL